MGKARQLFGVQRLPSPQTNKKDKHETNPAAQCQRRGPGTNTSWAVRATEAGFGYDTFVLVVNSIRNRPRAKPLSLSAAQAHEARLTSAVWLSRLVAARRISNGRSRAAGSRWPRRISLGYWYRFAEPDSHLTVYTERDTRPPGDSPGNHLTAESRLTEAERPGPSSEAHGRAVEPREHCAGERRCS